jgi:hypothetical protein
LYDKVTSMRSWFLGVIVATLICGIASLGLALIDLGFVLGGDAATVVLLLWIVTLVISVVAAMRSVSRERSYIGLLIPLIPIFIFATSLFAIPYAQYPRDYWRFQSRRSSYDAAVARLPRNGHRFLEFSWGGMVFASDGVVYDETDEIGLPFGLQSKAWKKRVPFDITCGGDGPVGEVLPLGQHYYVVGFGC